MDTIQSIQCSRFLCSKCCLHQVAVGTHNPLFIFSVWETVFHTSRKVQSIRMYKPECTYIM
jgi:hypothetical protein